MIDALGPRVPSAADSPRVHRQAFVFIRRRRRARPAGSHAPGPDSRAIRPAFFSRATENRMTVRTKLAMSGGLSPFSLHQGTGSFKDPLYHRGWVKAGSKPSATAYRDHHHDHGARAEGAARRRPRRRCAPLVPVFLSYVLSFVYVGIYWNNHHHMLHAVKHVSGAMLWANLHLLFWLSLIPFITGWMGENHFAPMPVARLRRGAADGGDRLLRSWCAR